MVLVPDKIPSRFFEQQEMLFMIRSILLVFMIVSSVHGQDEAPTADDVAGDVTGKAAQSVDVAKEVLVDPVNSDERISERLKEIMEATGWFTSPDVKVDRGVAFLSGTADSLKHQSWAEATAMRTSDVVAVVNRIKVAEKPFWNFAPAITSLRQLVREATGVLPLVAVAMLVVIVFYFFSIAGARIARWFMRYRIDSQLLCQVAGNVVAVLIFIIGVYVALRVSGLTRLAVTLLGGTGLVGLALGFAFRDIAENYLASILISLNHPFRVGDLIEVAGAKGFVRTVTTRGTVLNTLDGNQVQMPNSTVFKSQITNFTATPLSRQNFTVGIGFDDSITEAQEILMKVLVDHAGVVSDPAPLAIVESLGSATVNLRVYYWFDQTKHSPFKVSSSVIRQAKQKLSDARITMPDEAREMIFPQGVPVHIIDAKTTPEVPEVPKQQSNPVETEVSAGEGDLAAEQSEVMRVTREDETIKNEPNLIE